MPAHDLVFDVLAEPLAICRLAADDGVPAWATAEARFWSLTRRDDELSVMCPADAVPANVASVGPYRALVVEGPMDPSIVGVAAAFTTALAAASVAVMPVATHDTDVVLVREDQLAAAIDALRAAGFTVRD